MKSRMVGLIWLMAAGTPVFVGAAETIQPGKDRPVKFKMAQAASDGKDLPLSRESLFDLPPETAKQPEPAGRLEDPLPMSKDALFDLPPKAEKDVVPTVGRDETLPASKESLFDPPVKEHVEKAALPQSEQVPPASKEALFGDVAPLPVAPRAVPKSAQVWHGFLQTEAARTTASPWHWSKVMGRFELGTQGNVGSGVRWKASGRLDYNAVYDLNNFYSSAVQEDQRAEFHVRETYLDFSAADLEFRIGRQHIVWGEMVGLFVADVVSAKDMREFVLPDFQILRIPQWAVRSEYFKGDFHAELVWIPFPSYDNIGKPGAEFYPYPPALTPVIHAEEKPGARLANSNFGVRVSQLESGWDISGFYYRSMDSQQTFYRDASLVDFHPRHDRIWQAGATVAKDAGPYVFKAEAVYTGGRGYNVEATNITDADGVVKQNTLDWIVGLDFNPTDDTRVNAQFYQRIYFDHDPDIIPEQFENGVSFLVNQKLPHNWNAEALWVRSINRNDWLLRPKLTWGFRQNWKATFGLDVFKGPATGIFGQFDSKDRVYAEVRYDF